MPMTARKLIQTLLKFDNLDDEVKIEYCKIDYVQKIYGNGEGIFLIQTKQKFYTFDEMNILVGEAYQDGINHALAGVITNKEKV